MTPEAPPKKTSGCLVALAIVGAFFVLVALIVGIWTYKFVTSKEGQSVISAVGEGAQIMKEAMNAPGTAELRKLGCDVAMVLDMDKFQKLINRFNDAGGGATADTSVMVICQVKKAASAPTCDDAAHTYVGAVGAQPRKFAVMVQEKDRDKAVCSSTYAPSGSKIGDIASTQAGSQASPLKGIAVPGE